MAEEIEIKVRMESPGDFVLRMARQGFATEGTVFEVNRIFDDAAGTLRAKGCAVRIREAQATGTGGVRRTLLTFKGPRARSKMKRRPEFETTVGEAEPLEALFEAIGLREAFRYEKHRTTWPVGATEVTLDELPHIGWFVEVEGPSERAVRACLKKLGLTGLPMTDRDYIGLLQEHLRSLGRDTKRAVFEE
jgi:adenylate cyclase class 2